MARINRATAPYYFHISSADAVFVKDGDFFREQGGLKEDWGTHWEPVQAGSLADARRAATKIKYERNPNARQSVGDLQ